MVLVYWPHACMQVLSMHALLCMGFDSLPSLRCITKTSTPLQADLWVWLLLRCCPKWAPSPPCCARWAPCHPASSPPGATPVQPPSLAPPPTASFQPLYLATTCTRRRSSWRCCRWPCWPLLAPTLPRREIFSFFPPWAHIPSFLCSSAPRSTSSRYYSWPPTPRWRRHGWQTQMCGRNCFRRRPVSRCNQRKQQQHLKVKLLLSEREECVSNHLLLSLLLLLLQRCQFLAGKLHTWRDLYRWSCTAPGSISGCCQGGCPSFLCSSPHCTAPLGWCTAGTAWQLGTAHKLQQGQSAPVERRNRMRGC